jgi:hypothetical protein
MEWKKLFQRDDLKEMIKRHTSKAEMKLEEHQLFVTVDVICCEDGVFEFSNIHDGCRKQKKCSLGATIIIATANFLSLSGEPLNGKLSTASFPPHITLIDLFFSLNFAQLHCRCSSSSDWGETKK